MENIDFKEYISQAGFHAKANDVFGKLVYTTKNDKTINTTLLQNGVYFIDADTENGNIVKKIIITTRK